MICDIWVDLWSAIQTVGAEGASLWTWNDATIDRSNTSQGFSMASTLSACEYPGEWLVQAYYGEYGSHGVWFTTVCPQQTTSPLEPVCEYTNGVYFYGGAFLYQYTFNCQSGDLPASGLYWMEQNPVQDPNSTCDVGEFIATDKPAPLDTDPPASAIDVPAIRSTTPPNATCFDEASVTALLGVTVNAPWSCPYTNVSRINVSVTGNEATVTTTDNGYADDPCVLQF